MRAHSSSEKVAAQGGLACVAGAFVTNDLEGDGG